MEAGYDGIAGRERAGYSEVERLWTGRGRGRGAEAAAALAYPGWTMCVSKSRAEDCASYTDGQIPSPP